MSQLPAFLLPLFLTLATVFDGWLGVFLDTTEHPQVLEVIPDSPAAKAGLRVGDRFVSVDDTATPTTEAFVTAIKAGKAGQRVRLKVQRDGKELAVVVRLAERPPEDEIPAPSTSGTAAPTEPKEAKTAERPAGRGEAPAPAAEVVQKGPAATQDGGTPFLGVGLEEVDGGLQVTEVVPASPAATAGIEVDDVLVQFGKATIKTMADLEAALAKAKPGQQVELQLRHDSGRKSVVLTLGSKPAARGSGGLMPRPVPKPEPAITAPAPAGALAENRGWLGINNIDNNVVGVGVGGMVEGGPVEKAGLQVGDRIVAVDGHDIRGAGELMEFLGKTKPGQVVTLSVARGEQQLTKKVTLGTRTATPASGPIAEPVPAPAAPSEPATAAPAPAGDQRGFLGINPEDADEGVRIGGMAPGGVADKSGLQIGDRIVALDGHEIHSAEELLAFMGRTKVGQVVALKLVRGGHETTKKVTLGPRPASVVAAPAPSAPTRPADPAPPAAPAPLVVPVPAEQRGWLGVNLEQRDDGIAIASVAPDRAAAKAGLEAGDRIVSFDGDDLGDMEELQAFMAKSKPGQIVAVGLIRGDQELTRKVTLGTRDPAVPVPPTAGPPKPVRAPENRGEPKPVEAAATEPAVLPKAFGTDLARAERRASRANKPLLALVGTLADGACQAQIRTLGDQRVALQLGGFECVFVDAEQNERFVEHQQVRELPTLLVIQGGETARRAGYLPVDKLVAFLGEHQPLAAPLARPRSEARPAPQPGAATSPSADGLRAEIEALRQELAELRKALEELRRQRGGRE